MQRTFLRSDSEDLFRLQQYFHSSVVRTLRHDINTVEIVNKLVDKLENSQRRFNKLEERNKQLEEHLRKTNLELSTSKEKIKQLIAEKHALIKSIQIAPLQQNKQQHQQQKGNFKKPQKQAPSTEQQVHMFVLSPTTTTTNSIAVDNSSKSGSRKRSADKQLSNEGGADENDGIFVTKAPKRSLLGQFSERESLEKIDEGFASNNDKEQQQDGQQFLTANESFSSTVTCLNNNKPRRSCSVPPSKKPSIVSRPKVGAAGKQPTRTSRLAALRNNRISSSHGDLSKVALREHSPSSTDDDNNINERLLTGEHGAHSLQTKRNFLRIQCDRCELPIRFGVLYVKCVRCKATFHEACRMQAPLPCVVRKMTPKPMNIRYRLRLGDYCADNRPMVPPLITYCTFHLDRSVILQYEEIYNVDGDPQEVDAITKLFQSNKTFPKLENFNAIDIAGCIKKFLMQIREPLIPFTYGKEIISILEKPEKAGNLAGHIEDLLPPAHSDTLGHLCRHWKRLVVNSNGILTIPSLSLHVGPIVFGSLRPESILSNEAVINAMQALLELPNEFWINEF